MKLTSIIAAVLSMAVVTVAAPVAVAEAEELRNKMRNMHNWSFCFRRGDQVLDTQTRQYRGEWASEMPLQDLRAQEKVVENVAGRCKSTKLQELGEQNNVSGCRGVKKALDRHI
ncbi:hypothetical protein SLS60_006152 [Paraconiothyrium brasiliense]|uniref:Uncharacterized protein n=1 Tax=Paraconiothyrium brasiliense TaxID=300254 RepID=A0ABR3RE89_9PLEO